MKVHSVKNVINNYLSPLRPRQRFDPACLFVYGTSGTKQLMTTFITKSTGHSDIDWRKRTTWFTSDGHHNAILSDLDIQNFIIACTTLGTSGTHHARTMPDRPETTPTGISNPASTTQEQGAHIAFTVPQQHTPPSAIPDTTVQPDPLGMMAYCPQDIDLSDDMGEAINSLFWD